MPCNKPRRSTRPGKKKMVKACEDGKEKLVITELRATSITILILLRSPLEPDISVTELRIRCQPHIGLAKIFGLETRRPPIQVARKKLNPFGGN